MLGYKSVELALKSGFIQDITKFESKSNDSCSEITDNALEEVKCGEPEAEITFNRTHLLLSASQLITEHYPVPGIEFYKNFVMTRSEYKPVTPKSPMYSIDCEWCLCVRGKNTIIYTLCIVLRKFVLNSQVCQVLRVWLVLLLSMKI